MLRSLCTTSPVSPVGPGDENNAIMVCLVARSDEWIQERALAYPHTPSHALTSSRYCISLSVYRGSASTEPCYAPLDVPHLPPLSFLVRIPRHRSIAPQPIHSSLATMTRYTAHPLFFFYRRHHIFTPPHLLFSIALTTARRGR